MSITLFFLDVVNLPKTRVFISSSSQSKFDGLRNKSSEVLKQLGHEPVMWETSFGPWPNNPDKSTIDKCLEEVASSDVYFVFIADKAGSYVEADDSSVTHLELRKALELRKHIVVFVETSVSERYLGDIKAKIADGIKLEAETQKTDPDMVSVFEVVKAIPDIPEGIDPYTWVILHDCYNHNIFLEPLDLGVSVDERMPEYLTDCLRRGVALLPFEELIEKNQQRAREYGTFLQFSRFLLNTYRSQHWRQFLTRLSRVLIRNRGGQIVRTIGRRQEPLGNFRECSGISLNIFNGTGMERVEYDGLAEGEHLYTLDQSDKFVVQAYQADRNKDINLFYREDKQTLYLTVRAGGVYFLSLHFELEEKWTTARVNTYLQDIFQSVLWNHPNRNFILYAQLVLEGGTPV